MTGATSTTLATGKRAYIGNRCRTCAIAVIAATTAAAAGAVRWSGTWRARHSVRTAGRAASATAGTGSSAKLQRLAPGATTGTAAAAAANATGSSTKATLAKIVTARVSGETRAAGAAVKIYGCIAAIATVGVGGKLCTRKNCKPDTQCQSRCSPEIFF